MMADNVTNELLLETLKAIQATLAEHGQHFVKLENELKAVKHHIQGLVQSDLNKDGELAALSLRIARIERRLELTD